MEGPRPQRTLLLVRHGESVDNVAGVYAGTRDSPLTAHGVLQAQRLASHLADRQRSGDLAPTRHVFASNLHRACRTAEALAVALAPTPVVVTRLPELRERDFRSWEGRSYRQRGSAADGAGSAVGEQQQQQQQQPHPNAETHTEMRQRLARFIERHLVPALETTGDEDERFTVVIVAHGVILNVLLQVLQSEFSLPGTVRSTVGPGVAVSEYLVPWSNTGCLEAELTQTGNGPRPASAGKGSQPTWSLRIKAVNQVDHLQNLKKTRGGIGSARFDANQKIMDSFFRPASKKRKPEEEEASKASST